MTVAGHDISELEHIFHSNIDRGGDAGLMAVGAMTILFVANITEIEEAAGGASKSVTKGRWCRDLNRGAHAVLLCL